MLEAIGLNDVVKQTVNSSQDLDLEKFENESRMPPRLSKY
jgi:hypothetical protein